LGGEIELKARIDGRKAIAERIIALGGMFVREVSQEDVYFKHPCYNFKEKDEALRLRREGSACMLTFKGSRFGSGAKMREELEVGVEDYETATTILERVGFEKAFVIRKNRLIYSLEGAEVSLDSVEGLGEFVEVELILTDEMTEDVRNGVGAGEDLRKKLHGLAEKLQVPKDRLTTESYLELLASKSSSSKASK
jgi:adenylate cyclase class 2